MKREPIAKLVDISTPGHDQSWFMSFNKAVRSGALRSAWDDYDTEDDAFAGRKSWDTQSTAIWQEFERLRQEREESARRQEEVLRKAREEEVRRKADEAQQELENLEGFGSF